MNKNEITLSVRDYFIAVAFRESSQCSFGAEITKVRSNKSNTKNKSFSHSDVYNDGNDEVCHYGYCDWFGA